MIPMMSTQGRPVVVLAGWLGCHPRNLRRYVEMYERLGWTSLLRVASPASVVTAMTTGPLSITTGKQNGGIKYTMPPTASGKHHSIDKLVTRQPSSMLEMERLAIDTLQELQTLQCPRFIVHSFSNGGCFLWEWLRHMLFEQTPSSPVYSGIDTLRLRQKLAGLVFDSAPAYYEIKMLTLESVLEHVPSEEKERLLKTAKSFNKDAVGRRFDEYWSTLMSDQNDHPQFYLYSECDHLTCAKELEDLIRHRESLLGKGKISSHKFLDSKHCSHLLKHPEEYKRLIQQFIMSLDDCGGNLSGSMKSRL